MRRASTLSRIAAFAFCAGACHRANSAEPVPAPSAVASASKASSLVLETPPIPTDRCLTGGPNYDAYLTDGSNGMSSGNFSDALQGFSNALEERPGDSAAIDGVARALRMLTLSSDNTVYFAAQTSLEALGVRTTQLDLAADVSKVCSANRSTAAAIAAMSATSMDCASATSPVLEIAKKLDPHFDPGANCSALLDDAPTNADFEGTWNEVSDHFGIHVDGRTLTSAKDFCKVDDSCKFSGENLALLISSNDGATVRVLLQTAPNHVLAFVSDAYLTMDFNDGIRANVVRRGSLVWVHAVAWNEGRSFDAKGNMSFVNRRDVSGFDLVYDVATKQRVLRVVAALSADCAPARDVSVKATSSGFAYRVSVAGSSSVCEGEAK